MFSKPWNDEIAGVTGRREWQQADVRIIDPSTFDSSQYDPETNEYSGPPASVLYTGQARVITTRAGINSNDPQPNKSTLRTTRVQLPQHAMGLVRRNSKIIFTASPRNPALLRRIGTVTGDFQGSSAATRTFEVMFDGDAAVGDG